MKGKLARRSRLLLAAAAVATVLAGCSSAPAPAPPTVTLGSETAGPPSAGPRGQQANPVMPVPDFTLTDQNGKPFRVRDQQGRAMVLFPGYTACADACPLTMAVMAGAYAKLGADASKVVFVFITVDPERDTPQVLKEYVAKWDFPVEAVSGSEKEMAKVWDGLRIMRQREDLGNGTYAIGHSNRVWLVDPKGRIRLSQTLGTTSENVAADLHWLLQS